MNIQVLAKESESQDLSFLNPPSILYHYTSSSGLQGILETGSIWATDIEFLNDEQELRHGLDQFFEILHEKIRTANGSKLHLELAKGLEKRNLSRHAVACFCQEGDLLSQWRGYASPGGYAIGLATPSVAENLKARHEDSFARVWYDPSHVARIAGVWAGKVADGFGETFADAMEAMDKISDEDEKVEELAKRLYTFDSEHMTRAVRLCSLLKNPSFKEEQEWRLVRETSFMGGSFSERMKFRQGPFGLTPYTTIDLKSETGELPISEIIVGPGANLDLRMTAVRMLLGKMGYSSEIPVIASAIPYRP